MAAIRVARGREACMRSLRVAVAALVGVLLLAAGGYEFFCKYHPQGMRGTVTVT
jgi:plastocyanin